MNGLFQFSSLDAIQFSAKIVLLTAVAYLVYLLLIKVGGVRASHRHRLLTAAMIASWCIGAWTALLPTLDLPVIPVAKATASGTTQNTSIVSSDSISVATSDSTPIQSTVPPANVVELKESHDDSVDGSQTATVSPSLRKKSASQPIPLTWQSKLILVWLLGCLLLTIRLAIGIFRLKQSIFRWSATEDQLLVSTLKPQTDSAKQILSFNGPIRYCVGPDDQMPFAFGIMQPVICLPGNLGQWSEAEIQSVIYHEVSHIARHDTVWDLIAEITKAIFWWNPFTWLLCRQHELERELACDEQVLSANQPADQYASALVSIVRRANKVAGLGATPMARKSQLDGRVRKILFENRDLNAHKPVVLVSGLFLILCVPLMGLSATTYLSKQETSEPKTASSSVAVLDEKELAEISKKRKRLIETTGQPEAPIISTHGLILDENGVPLAGAEVAIQIAPFYRSEELFFQGYRDKREPAKKTNSVIAKITTDKSGTFRFDEVQAPEYFLNRNFPRYRLIIRAPGKGLEWVVLKSPVNVKSRQITLRPEATVKGTVVSKEGKPIAGAQVTAISFAQLEKDVDGTSGDPRRISNRQKNEIDVSTTTRADGSFELRGLPDGKRVGINVSRDGYVSSGCLMAVGDFDPAIISKIEESVYVDKVESGDQQFELERSRTLSGKVVYEDTGLPVANCKFFVRGALGHYYDGFQTNSEGRFSPVRLKGNTAIVRLSAYKQKGYVRSFEEVGFSEKEYEKETTLTLNRGERITGVVKNELGEPVEGAKLYYLPDGPVPIKHYVDAIWGDETTADGEFEIFLPLGTGSLHAIGFPKNAVVPSNGDAWRSKNPEAGGLVEPHVKLVVDGMENPDVELVARTGLRLGGTVVLPDGNVAAGATLQYKSHEYTLQQIPEEKRNIDVTTDGKGKFKLQAVPRPSDEQSSFIHIFHSAVFKVTSSDGKFSKYVDVEKFDRNFDVEIKLRPVASLSGSAFVDGKALPGAPVTLRALGHRVAKATTDEFGKFEFANLATGPRYTVRIDDPNSSRDQSESIVLEKDSTLNPIGLRSK